MKIYHWPHDTLSQVSVPCEPTDYKDEFEEQMKKLMVESNGIGLAANQIGMTQRFSV